MFYLQNLLAQGCSNGVYLNYELLDDKSFVVENKSMSYSNSQTVWKLMRVCREFIAGLMQMLALNSLRPSDTYMRQ